MTARTLPPSAGAGSSQRITERTSERRYFFLLPNLADDAQLDVFAFRLLAHYKRVAGEQGVCTETTRDTAAHCGMSPRKVVDARTTLARQGWIDSSIDGPIGQQVVSVTLIDRMPENVARYSRQQPGEGLHVMQAEGAAPGAGAPPAVPAPGPKQEVQASPEARAAGGLHRVQPAPAGGAGYTGKNTEDPEKDPLPSAPSRRHQQGMAGEEPGPGTESAARVASTTAESARELVHRFYTALGAAMEQLTPALLRREFVIATQLADIGATPDEAEAYARDMLASRDRLAPLDLRSFERERLSWLARRQHSRGPQRHLVDRTGEWLRETDREAEPLAPAENPANAGRVAGGDRSRLDVNSRAGALARSLFRERP